MKTESSSIKKTISKGERLNWMPVKKKEQKPAATAFAKGKLLTEEDLWRAGSPNHYDRNKIIP